MKHFEIVEELRGQGRKSLSAAEYMALAGKTYPEERADADGGTRRFRAILDELKDAGVVRFPARGPRVSFGAHQFPAEFSIVGEKKEVFVRPTVEWDARLAAAGARATRSSISDLLALNAFLQKMKTEKTRAAPVNARSLEIFGDEKRLRAKLVSKDDDLLPEGIRLTDLDCYVPADHYLPSTAFESSSRTALIVENHETYHVMKNRNRTSGEYRAVILGNGKSLLSGYQCLPELAIELDIRDFVYFGDVDVPGFEIPIAASHSLERIARMSLKPAVPLYQECLERGCPTPTSYKDRYDAQKAWQAVSGEVREWFGAWDSGVEKIDAIMRGGMRIAQEWVY